MTDQEIIYVSEDYKKLDKYLTVKHVKKLLLVCGPSIKKLGINDYFEKLESRKGIGVVRFDKFKPNPQYESVVLGVELFQKEKCDAIFAVGGGSAMDVAKCIKLYSNMDSSENYLQQIIEPNDVKLFAMPTTAGTGSEATRYAVIYYNGEKQSVSDYSCIPSMVVFDMSVLKTLPVYQKKATALDALCHAIESCWSVNSTEESQKCSVEAIEKIMTYMKAYLNNEDAGNSAMLEAANIAGKAINITETTAGHAMCYKLTSLYGIAHGHAVALCVSALFPFLVENMDKCIDKRGKEHLRNALAKIANAMCCADARMAAEKFRNMLFDMELQIPIPDVDDFELLKTSVNPVRLKNNPVELDEGAIDMLYHQILA